MPHLMGDGIRATPASLLSFQACYYTPHE